MSKKEADKLADTLELVNECYPFTAIEDAIAKLRQWPDVGTSMSWDGFNIYGSIESVYQVAQMQHAAGTVPELKQRIKSDAARIAELEKYVSTMDAAQEIALTSLYEFQEATKCESGTQAAAEAVARAVIGGKA